MIKEIDAAVKENPTLKDKLEPLRKRLESAQGKLGEARIREDGLSTLEEAAKAAGGRRRPRKRQLM